MGHFGHFIAECWSRLWYVVQNPDLKSKILFITTTHGGYKSWFDEFFRLMGIDKERIIYVRQPTQCRSVTVPEQSQYNQFHSLKFTKEFFLPYQAIKSHVTPSKNKKLYMTRKNVIVGNYRRFCFNEEYFEDFFTAHGFKVIAPEKLSIEEQISLVTGADEIACTLGTLSHWAMFCKPTAKFIMLARDSSIQSFQIFINEAFHVDEYYIVESYKSFLYVQSHIDGVFMLGSNRYWKEFVADYFGEKIDEDDGNSYIDAAIDKYVDTWSKKYSDPKEITKWTDSLRSMCHRNVALETRASKNRPLISYQTHVSKKGWGVWNSENLLSNPINQQLDIQAIKIDFSESFQETRHALYYSRKKGWSKKNSKAQMSIETIKRDFTEPFHKIYYAVYYNDKEGWSEEVTNGQMAGTTGKSKAITGIKIRLDKAGAKEFDILYRVHKFDGEWTAWAKNGEEIISNGVKLNSIQIRLKSK